MSAANTNQRIDGKRLWDLLMSMAEIGATPKGGVRRLTLTDVDKRGRDRFRAHCEAAGLTVRVDAIGNMFARRPGRDPARPPVLFGSHLDSQPSGGKFDGALGVLAGLEVMQSLNDLGITTEAPVELVNWTDEEGARFGHSLAGSGVWAGVYPEQHILALKDTDGVTVAEAIDQIGYRGPEPARPFPADAYFELHIEQGPILERESKQIGIVTGAQAQVWYDAVAIAITLLMNPRMMMGKTRIARYVLNAVKSPRLIVPKMTKCPPRARIITVARFTARVITGIRADMMRRMLRPMFFASALAAMNF